MTPPIFPVVLAIVITCMVFLVLLIGYAGTSRFKANKQAAMSFDLSAALSAHMERVNCSRGHALRLDMEFRRWFVVAAASPVLVGMASHEVDEYWHTLLAVDGGGLYRAFSEAVAGREVRHVEGVGSDDLSARAWVAYETIWGSTPPLDLFSAPDDEAIRLYRKHVRETSASDGGDGGTGFVSLDFGSSCSGDSGHGCDGGSHGGDAGGHGCGGGGDGGGCGGGGE